MRSFPACSLRVSAARYENLHRTRHSRTRLVIPAEAGIQTVFCEWIPACAGMTMDEQGMTTNEWE